MKPRVLKSGKLTSTILAFSSLDADGVHVHVVVGDYYSLGLSVPWARPIDTCVHTAETDLQTEKN